MPHLLSQLNDPNECIKIALKVKAKPDSSIDKIIQVFKDCESVFIKKSQHYFYFIAPKISIVVKKYVSNVENEMAEEDSWFAMRDVTVSLQ